MTRPGHRAYIDNPRLISVQAWRPPVPKGHRTFIEPRREDRASIREVRNEAA